MGLHIRMSGSDRWMAAGWVRHARAGYRFFGVLGFRCVPSIVASVGDGWLARAIRAGGLRRGESSGGLSMAADRHRGNRVGL